MNKNLTPEQAAEYIKAASDIMYCAKVYAKVFDKGRGNYVPFELFPTQERVLNNYLNNDFNIVSKYRQGGITTLTTFFLAWKITFTPNYTVALVANKLETSKDEILKKVMDFMECFPEWMQAKPSKINKQNHKRFDNGSELKAVAAGKEGLRGYSPAMIFMDEAAFFEYGYQFYTAAKLSLAAGGSAIMVSTPNGQDQLYYQTYQNAGREDGSGNQYVVSEIYWYEDPRYNENLSWYKLNEEKIEIDRIHTKDPKVYQELIKQGYKPTSPWFILQCNDLDNDERRIAAELENSFLGSSANFVHQDIIERHQKRYVTEPIRKVFGQQTWIWEDPIPGHKYILGSDVSLGTSEDFSSIQIFRLADDGSVHQVLEFLGKMPPDALAGYIYDYGTSYNAYAVIDITGGVGVNTVTKLLELGYPKKLVHHQQLRAAGIKDHMSDLEQNNEYPGFSISTGNRPLILNEFEKLVRHDEFKIRSKRLVNELKTFVIMETGKPDHMRGYHDDLIFAAAMPLYAYLSKNAQVQQTPERTRAIMEAFAKLNGHSSGPDDGDDAGKPYWKRKKNKPLTGGAAIYEQHRWLFGNKTKP